MSQWSRAVLVSTLGTAVALSGCAVNAEGEERDDVARQATALEGPTCKAESFSVTVDPNDPPAVIAGELCGRGPTLLLTLHGATYNRTYWNWPQNSELSFVKNQRPSVSILNIDLLGSGLSSRPPSEKVNGTTQASTVHQIVTAMRARGFKKVVLVGHSSGSGVAVREASTYNDVDGVILTGYLHGLAAGGGQVPDALYPAQFDPKFADLGLDTFYSTTLPGTRSMSAFYNTAITDPATIAFDEINKDVVTLPSILDFVDTIFNPTHSLAIRVPVLTLVGQYDAGFCDLPDCPLAASEGANWSPEAQHEIHVIPNAGHNIHLAASTAPVEYTLIRDWLKARFD